MLLRKVTKLLASAALILAAFSPRRFKFCARLSRALMTKRSKQPVEKRLRFFSFVALQVLPEHHKVSQIMSGSFLSRKHHLWLR